MITKRISELLREREFISMATCDFEGRPNAAPKFLLKIENNFIYVVDYIIGKTFQNVKINPRASLSFVDTASLKAYQVNGPVEIIENGQEYQKIQKELMQKEIDLSTKRIIEGVISGRSHEGYELTISDRFIVYKIKIEEATEIGPSGVLKREKV